MVPVTGAFPVLRGPFQSFVVVRWVTDRKHIWMTRGAESAPGVPFWEQVNHGPKLGLSFRLSATNL